MRSNVADYRLDAKLIHLHLRGKCQLYVKPFLCGTPMRFNAAFYRLSHVKDRDIYNFKIFITV